MVVENRVDGTIQLTARRSSLEPKTVEPTIGWPDGALRQKPVFKYSWRLVSELPRKRENPVTYTQAPAVFSDNTPDRVTVWTGNVGHAIAREPLIQLVNLMTVKVGLRWEYHVIVA